MCIIKERKPNVIRHYTDVGALLKILDGGLRFSRPKDTWDDLNDYYCIRKFEEIAKKKAYILCFCENLGNAHHWYYFGNSIQTPYESCYNTIKCNIKIDWKSVEPSLQLLSDRLMFRRINYSTTAMLHKNIHRLDDLLFVKRAEYEVEKEWRAVIVRDENDASEPTPLRLSPKSIVSVNLFMDPDSPMYCFMKNLLLSKYPWLNDKIDNSGVHKSAKWSKEIDDLIMNL